MAATLGLTVRPQEDVNPLDRTLERAKAGSADAFRELVEAISPEFIGLLTQRLCPDEETASAVLQDAWVLSWRRLSTFDSTTHLRQWLYRVSANNAISLLRRGVRQRKVLGKIASGAPCSSFRDLGVVDEHPLGAGDAVVREAVEHLPEQYRPVAALSFLYGCNAAEISDLLDLSKPAIKMRLHRARCLLLECLRGAQCRDLSDRRAAAPSYSTRKTSTRTASRTLPYLRRRSSGCWSGVRRTGSGASACRESSSRESTPSYHRVGP